MKNAPLSVSYFFPIIEIMKNNSHPGTQAGNLEK